MTDREKAIVMAHTGICMLEGEKLDVFYQYLNELYGRPVYTHEWVTLDIKEKSKPDFLQLCKEEESVRHGKWIPVTEELPKKEGQYFVSGKWANKDEEVWICDFVRLCHISGWCNDASRPVIQAWMSLPNPYKEDEQNG